MRWLNDRPSLSRLEEARGWLGAQPGRDPQNDPDTDTAPPVQRPEKNA